MTEFDTDLASANLSIRSLMRWFTGSTLVVGLGAVGWAYAATIPSAVITEGTFVVSSNSQAIQHLEGGIVGEILVKDGDLVRQGQVVARLDAAQVTSDISTLKRKLVDLIAEQTRLIAERDNRDQLVSGGLPPLLQSEQISFDLALASQQALLLDHLSARQSQLSQLSEHKRQVETQIDGLARQRQALSEQLAQTMADLVDQKKLDALRLIRRPVLRQTERDVSRLGGELGDVEARTASSRSQLSETEFHINETTRMARSEILSKLQSVTSQIAQTNDQFAAASDRSQRLEIRAPRTGYVHELAIHTLGGTVAPGQALMRIIPNSEPLLVTAKIRPEDIDEVHIGQEAKLRITSFKLAVTPELAGRVASLSPDQVIDEKTGRGYFTAKIDVQPGEDSKLGSKELIPGLPAEVLILGQSRSVLTYLTQPLTEKLGLAFREK